MSVLGDADAALQVAQLRLDEAVAELAGATNVGDSVQAGVDRLGSDSLGSVVVRSRSDMERLAGLLQSAREAGVEAVSLIERSRI